MENEILDSDLSRQDDERGSIRYAGFWVRAGATFIDMLVLLPFSLLSIYNSLNMKIFLLAVLQSLIYIAYKPLMEWKYGATLGKMAMKIKVVNYNDEPLTVDQSYMRFIFYFITAAFNILLTYQLFQQPEFADIENFMELGLFQTQMESPMQDFSQIASFVVMLSIIFVIFDDHKQALHDKIAKTYCIYAEK